MTDPTTPTPEAGRALTHEQVVERLATLIRNEAYPAFHLAPPPEWASRAAEAVIRWHQPMLRDDLLAQARADERRRLAGLVGLAPPVHIAQAFTATDHGATEHRPDDCLYRGDFLAIINADTEPAP